MALDSFTGTDGTALATHDANWGDASATYVVSGVILGSNQATLTGVWSVGGGRYTTSTSDVSQIVVKAVASAANTQKILFVRGNGTHLGYGVYLSNPVGGNWTWMTIVKDTTYLNNWSGLSISQTADHTVRLEVSGTTTASISVYIDTVSVGSAKTDSSSPYQPGGNPGFYILGDGTTGNLYVDDWTDGAGAAAVTGPFPTFRPDLP